MGSQECRGPPEEMGQEGIRPPDAGVGQARRQAKGERQEEKETEREVNCEHLQTWLSLLVQIHVARGAGP
jgi:hypothetical protein